MKYKKEEIEKVNKLWNFITHIDQCTKKEFDKLCNRKEVKRD